MPGAVKGNYISLATAPPFAAFTGDDEAPDNNGFATSTHFPGVGLHHHGIITTEDEGPDDDGGLTVGSHGVETTPFPRYQDTKHADFDDDENDDMELDLDDAFDDELETGARLLLGNSTISLQRGVGWAKRNLHWPAGGFSSLAGGGFASLAGAGSLFGAGGDEAGVTGRRRGDSDADRNSQSIALGKAVRMAPSNPYGEPEPEKDGRGDGGSDVKWNSMNGLNPLFEKLLPAQDDTSLYVDIGNRKPRDVAFTILYVLCLGIMSFAGLIYLFTTSSRGLDKIVPRPIYTTIRDSAGLLSITITVAVGIAVLWLSLLRSFVRPVVLITVAAIPITCLLGFAAILTNSVLGKVHDPSYLGPQYDGMIAVASGFLISGVASCVFLLRRRKQIEQTIHILQLSCDILRTNPGIFAVSILLTIGYVIFAATWLFLFSHLFLKGLKETDPTGVVRWHMNASTGWVAAFYVLMYFWTSAIFKNVEKTTIAGVVGEWYFQRADSTHSRDRTIKNFKSAITKSFGSIAFASLILGVIQTLQFLTRMARGRSSKRTALNSFLSSCLDCWGRLADNISSYALVYVGLSGESFCTAAYRTTRIFRRNLILGLVTSTVTRLILLMGTVTIAFLCGVVTFFFASRGLESPFAYIVGVVGTVVPYYIVQVLGHVVQNTVDATFICYLLDLDTNSCHCESAHRIFGTSIS